MRAFVQPVGCDVEEEEMEEEEEEESGEEEEEGMEKRVSQKRNAGPQLRVTLYPLCANERSTEWKSRRRVEKRPPLFVFVFCVSRCFFDRRGTRRMKQRCETKGIVRKKEKGMHESEMESARGLISPGYYP